MEIHRLGSSGLPVSELILGAMLFGTSTDEATAIRMIDRFREEGGNAIDTANVYGRGVSEEVLGRALKGIRHEVVLLTKVRSPMGKGPLESGLSRRHILDSIDASLRRLQTDFVDVLQIHRWDVDTPIEETLDALNACVLSGKVRYIGCSNLTGWQIAHALGVSERNHWAKFVVLQPEYSLVLRDLERELLPACRYFGVGVIPWSPLGGGILTGKYQPGQPPPAGTRGEDRLKGPMAARWQSRLSEQTFATIETVARISAETGKTAAQIALRWVMEQPGITAPIVGARTLEQLEDNLGAIGWALSAEQRAALSDVSAIPLGYPHDLAPDHRFPAVTRPA